MIRRPSPLPAAVSNTLRAPWWHGRARIDRSQMPDTGPPPRATAAGSMWCRVKPAHNCAPPSHKKKKHLGACRDNSRRITPKALPSVTLMMVDPVAGMPRASANAVRRGGRTSDRMARRNRSTRRIPSPVPTTPRRAEIAIHDKKPIRRPISFGRAGSRRPRAWRARSVPGRCAKIRSAPAVCARIPRSSRRGSGVVGIDDQPRKQLGNVLSDRRHRGYRPRF